jgi:hypothetical protein
MRGRSLGAHQDASGRGVLNLIGTEPLVRSIQGKVTDGQNKPIAGAFVTITRTFAKSKDVTTPYGQSVKTASDGSFLAQGLPPGTYSSCARAPGDGYVRHRGGESNHRVKELEHRLIVC